MAKRGHGNPDFGGRHRKRLPIVHDAPTSEPVHSSRQLHMLLTFDQDVQKSRHGLQSFKLLLDAIAAEDENQEQLGLLKDYLQSTKPKIVDEGAVYLSDLLEMWSYGVQLNNDNLMSAVPVVLDLLLKTISSMLDMVQYGLGLCRTVLQRSSLELVARNLAADKGKDFIISPTLRLLREVVSYDGGTFAKAVFRARNHTFRSLARNMGLRYLGEGIEDGRRASTRSTAIRFCLTALKYLHTEAKKELFSQKELGFALVRFINSDPPSLVKDILESLKEFVADDLDLPREVKSRFFTSPVLARLASLYGYEHDKAKSEDGATVADAAHEFLTDLCTSADAGVLRRQTGYYPHGIDPDQTVLGGTGDTFALGLESIAWFEEFENVIPVQNFILADFISPKGPLKPWSNSKQSALMVNIMGAAPELIADYYSKNRAFSLDPKETTTWIGYMAFSYNAVQLEIPKYFGHEAGYALSPPPTSVVLDNIMPLPFNQKILTRGLLNSSQTISFITTRFLMVSFEKLQTAVKYHEEASEGASASVWDDAQKKLVDEFCQRIPNISEVFKSYRAIPNTDNLQLEATARLLRAYYEVVPKFGLLGRYDIALFLSKVLSRLDRLEKGSSERPLALSELQALLFIASYSYDMRWFVAGEGLPFSPFTCLLRLCADEMEDLPRDAILEALESVSIEEQLFLPKSNSFGLRSLLQTAKETLSNQPAKAVWTFLDACANRCSSKAIKYLEISLELPRKSSDRSETVSPLVVAMMEQLPYFDAEANSEVLTALGRLLSRVIFYSKRCGEDEITLEAIREKIESVLEARGVVLDILTDDDRISELPGPDEPTPQGLTPDQDIQELARHEAEAAHSFLELTPSIVEDSSALYKWASKSMDELMDDGTLQALMVLLSSTHMSIRKEALTNLRKAALKIRGSSYEDKDQIWLLVCELVETAAASGLDTQPLPMTISAFASHAVDVLKDPLHALYPKVNTFLARSPKWDVDRVPLVHDVLQEPPTNPNALYTETSWLLGYLLEGLSGPQDLAVFHKRRVFEQFLSFAENPYIRWNLMGQVLRILYRATAIDGGATTLVTRFGVWSWLEARKAAAETAEQAAVYAVLVERIWETCDQARVNEWAGIEIKSLAWN